MRLVERLARRKAWSEPPFWDSDRLITTWGLTPDREKIGNDYGSYVNDAYKSCGVVFACILARQLVFSEARFQWREYRNGRPGELFGSPGLALLEQPWPGGTTGELLARMEVVASLAGNYYGTTADDAGRLGRAATGPGRRVVHMRPEWTTLIIHSETGDPNGLDARVVGYLYEPRSVVVGAKRAEPVTLLPDEVCHYSPIPDPDARFRGMSWLTPILREIWSDKAATDHKGRFFENAATPNMAVKMAAGTTKEQFTEFVDLFRKHHRGKDKAYETLFLAGGADVTVLGKDLKELDFKATQGAGETRIAAAARVPPVIVGLSEGLAGSSLNAGNYGASRRNFADGTLRPLWRIASASLQPLVPLPRPGASLWYDDRDIAFLRDDTADLAETRQKDANTLRALVDAGFDPDAAVEFVTTGDLKRLTGRHSGLFSVQLQPPGQQETAPQEVA